MGVRKRTRGIAFDVFRISTGGVAGVKHVNKFGRNPDTDPAASANVVPVGRDIWDGGIAGATAWVPPTAARVHNLASSDDEDGGAGTDTGALTAQVFGLDANYALQDETVTLNGTTDAPTANAYTMIHRIECLTFGSAGRNLGAVAATAVTDGTVTAQVTIDMNQTLMAIYQIPAGSTGYITQWHGDIYKSGGAAKFSDQFLMSKKFGAGWRVRDTMALSTDAQPTNIRTYDPWKKLIAKEYIKVAANPSAVAQDIGSGFDIVVVEN